MGHDIYGSEGFSVTLVQSEEELAAIEEEATMAGVGGVYVTQPIEVMDTLAIVFVNLADDGTAEGAVHAFGSGEAPSVVYGEWTDNGDGTVTVTMLQELSVTADGAEVVDMETPDETVFEVGATGELTGEDLTLYPASAIGAQAEEAAPLLFVSDVLPAADTEGRIVSLALAEDGGAALATDYMNGEDPIVEVGTWEESDDGTVAVTLTGTEDEEYDAPTELVFEADGDVLTTVEWDKDLYGEEGLTLTLVQDSGTESGTMDDAGDATGADEPDMGATLVFASDELPSADTDGLIITATFSEDGAVEFSSDYMNDEDPIVEVGTWEETEDGTIAVTVTGTADEEYDKAVELSFEVQDDGSLFAADWGEEGLTLNPVE